MARRAVAVRVLGAIACVALVLAVAGAAAAQRGHGAQAVGGADYGGGALGAGFSKKSFKGRIVTLRVAGDGRSVRTFAYVPFRCNLPRDGLKGETTGGGPNRGKVDATGAFSIRATRRYRVSGTVRATEKIQLKGKIVAGRASGTVFVSKVLRRRGKKGSDRCTSGDLNWDARSANDLPDVPGPAQPGATYYGAARQSPPLGPGSVSLRVSSDGKQVEFATQMIDMGCKLQRLDPSLYPATPIRADGTFSTSRSVTASGGGTRLHFVIRLAGRFVAGGVRGTIGETLSLRKNGKTSTCSTTGVSFAAIQ
jgi:hypothetical protein